MTDIYMGCASGTTRKVLRTLEEPRVMLSYTTRHNTPWPVDSLFVDSGGYSLMAGGGNHGPVADYAAYIERFAPDRWVVQDYPCEPDVLEDNNATVAEHQDLTTERTLDILDLRDERDLPGRCYAVVQGWDVSDYTDHLTDLRDHGVLSDADGLGIGSVCRRHAAGDLREILLSVAAQVDLPVHAFGVKQNVLQYPEVVRELDSVDTQSYNSYPDRRHGDTFKNVAHAYLKQRAALRDMVKAAEGQRGLSEFRGGTP